MSDPTAERLRAQHEAAGWFARLSHLSVTAEALKDFQTWRRGAANAQAYREVEASWAAAGALSGDAEIKAATAEVLRRRPARAPPLPRTFGGARLALAALCVLAVGAVVAWTFAPGPTYRTQVGERRLVVLDDGTRMQLNTDSTARIRYRAGERRVELTRGEAYFEVAHNAARPFIVQADGASVRALGTKFDVWRDGAAVRVSLLEGQVRVARTGEAAAAILAPNQRLTVTAGGISAPAATDAAEATAWTSGQLIFHATPLEQAIAQVNRYGAHKVTLDGPMALSRQPVSGAFNAGDTAAFVAAVHTLFDLKVVTDTDGDIRLVTAKPYEG